MVSTRLLGFAWLIPSLPLSMEEPQRLIEHGKLMRQIQKGGDLLERTQTFPVERISPEGGEFFFGYYDLMPFSQNDEYHLCHKINLYDRMPEKNDEAIIGLIEIARRKFYPLAHTLTWNFQQGSMLQWNPASSYQEVIYNNYLEGNYRGIILNIRTGQSRILERPVACVDASGRYALSINFGRLYDYRPGYGYLHRPDPFKRLMHPREDGVFIVELSSGECRPLLSLEEIWQFARKHYRLVDSKIVINHVTFNPAGDRFVLLARTDQGTKRRRITLVITANIDGKELRCLRNQAFASHYHWRDDRHLLIYCRHHAGKQLYLWEDRTHAEPKIVDPEFFLADGHCSYSPDRKWILYDDSNPVSGQRGLYRYHIQRRAGERIGQYNDDPKLFKVNRDLRCDLHPRWNSTGAAISFDSVRDGARHIYTMRFN